MNKIICCCIFLTVYLTGCTNLGSVRVSAGFKGIQDHIATYGSADILIVHGIGTRSENYSLKLQENIASKIGAVRPVFKRLPLFDPSMPESTNPDPVLITTKYDLPEGGDLVFYEVNWWPLALGRGGLRSTSEEQTAVLNRLVKDQLVTASLADAILYLGSSGPKVRRAVRETLCYIVTQTNHANVCNLEKGLAYGNDITKRPLLIVSQSLGSRIIFDTLIDIDRDPELASVAQSLLSKTESVYMLANQLSLLELAYTPPNLGDSQAVLLDREIEDIRGCWLDGQCPSSAEDCSAVPDLNALPPSRVKASIEEGLACIAGSVARIENDLEENRHKTVLAEAEKETIKRQRFLDQLTGELEAAEHALTAAAAELTDHQTSLSNYETSPEVRGLLLRMSELDAYFESLSENALQTQSKAMPPEIYDSLENKLKDQLTIRLDPLLKYGESLKKFANYRNQKSFEFYESRIRALEENDLPKKFTATHKSLDSDGEALDKLSKALEQLESWTQALIDDSADSATLESAYELALESVESNLNRLTARNTQLINGNFTVPVTSAQCDVKRRYRDPDWDSYAFTATCFFPKWAEGLEQPFQSAGKAASSVTQAFARFSLSAYRQQASGITAARQAHSDFLEKKIAHLEVDRALDPLRRKRAKQNNLTDKRIKDEAKIRSVKGKIAVAQNELDRSKILELNKRKRLAQVVGYNGIQSFDNLVQKSRVVVASEQDKFLDNLASIYANTQPGAVARDIRRSKRHKQSNGIEFIVFSDRNDLLNYRVDQSFADKFHGIRFVNVHVPLTNEYLHVLSDPVAAHRGHLTSKDVVKFMSCGDTNPETSTSGAQARLKARIPACGPER